MTTTLLQTETLEREQEESTTASITSNKMTRKFPGHPFIIARPVHSIAQSLPKEDSIDVDAERYYLSLPLAYSANIPVLSQPYEIGTIEEQPKELSSDDIAVHDLARSIAGNNFDVVKFLPTVRRGKFTFILGNSFSDHFPRPQPKLQNLESDLEEESHCRGVFPLSNSTKVIFSEIIEIKVDKLPSWKPNIVIDSYRLEDDSE